jgi:hypothetical protein
MISGWCFCINLKDICKMPTKKTAERYVDI